jgi:hypothetical protein
MTDTRGVVIENGLQINGFFDGPFEMFTEPGDHHCRKRFALSYWLNDWRIR